MSKASIIETWNSIINQDCFLPHLNNVININDEEERKLSLLSRLHFLWVMGIKQERDELYNILSKINLIFKGNEKPCQQCINVQDLLKDVRFESPKAHTKGHAPSPNLKRQTLSEISNIGKIYVPETEEISNKPIFNSLSAVVVESDHSDEDCSKSIRSLPDKFPRQKRYANSGKSPVLSKAKVSPPISASSPRVRRSLEYCKSSKNSPHKENTIKSLQNKSSENFNNSSILSAEESPSVLGSHCTKLPPSFEKSKGQTSAGIRSSPPKIKRKSANGKPSSTQSRLMKLCKDSKIPMEIQVDISSTSAKAYHQTTITKSGRLNKDKGKSGDPGKVCQKRSLDDFNLESDDVFAACLPKKCKTNELNCKSPKNKQSLLRRKAGKASRSVTPRKREQETSDLSDFDEDMNEEIERSMRHYSEFASQKAPAGAQNGQSKTQNGRAKLEESARTPASSDLATKNVIKIPGSRLPLQDSFDMLPADDHSAPGFAHQHAVVRKKDERRKLPGWDCKECEDFYEAMELSPSQMKHAMNRCSRHRSRYKPVTNTPAGFWNPDFDDSD